MVFEEYHKGLFERFHKTDESMQATLDSFLKRWSPGAIKVAILCQYLIDGHSREIGDAAMSAGISMLLYAEQSTRLLFDGELGESEHQAKQRRVIDYIAKKGGKVARSKLISSRVLDGGIPQETVPESRAAKARARRSRSRRDPVRGRRRRSLRGSRLSGTRTPSRTAPRSLAAPGRCTRDRGRPTGGPAPRSPR